MPGNAVDTVGRIRDARARIKDVRGMKECQGGIRGASIAKRKHKYVGKGRKRIQKENKRR